jgi:hypothetical protein
MYLLYQTIWDFSGSPQDSGALMEGLTRLVTESLVRHGFDRPLDYRRLHWSRWFRCESHHSFLSVPSKPGVFAIAEEIVSEAEDRPFRPLPEGAPRTGALASAARRMLAVTQFFEAEDMAFLLDRMISFQNPMRARLASGKYFVRFVVIEDDAQRHSILSALNQWIADSAEKATGIGSHFATSLELTPATEYNPANDAQQNLFHTTSTTAAGVGSTAADLTIAPQVDSGAATNIHCPPPFPAGF